eukprot:CAMPEP_0171059022 /NCGR_PEP_ID=MMETSP0766_2-20121228/2922_1 /TAXON_ID=439317 /ORGANISM="Gambierdiscus australes, Strain CAWD 149" /LENGTH=36 /DNA_ID= /DNA_START= /DNA_END= /DNA_ORIENTATION=
MSPPQAGFLGRWRLLILGGAGSRAGCRGNSARVASV